MRAGSRGCGAVTGARDCGVRFPPVAGGLVAQDGSREPHPRPRRRGPRNPLPGGEQPGPPLRRSASVTAVTSTGIYCRPSCPARTPLRGEPDLPRDRGGSPDSRLSRLPRCRPDAVPGAPGWDVAADTAGRAMRLINDGIVEREGVQGSPTASGYSPRTSAVSWRRARRRPAGDRPLTTSAHRAAAARDDRAAAHRRRLRGRVRQRPAVQRHDRGPSTTRLPRGCAPKDADALVPIASLVGVGDRSPGRGPTAVELRLPCAPRSRPASPGLPRCHLVRGVEDAGPGWYARTLACRTAPGTSG